MVDRVMDLRDNGEETWNDHKQDLAESKDANKQCVCHKE